MEWYVWIGDFGCKFGPYVCKIFTKCIYYCLWVSVSVSLFTLNISEMPFLSDFRPIILLNICHVFLRSCLYSNNLSE